MFNLEAEPAIAEALVLHHLQLAAACFELTSDDGGESLIKRLSEAPIDVHLRAIMTSFIYNMDSLLSDTIPTPIPNSIIEAGARAEKESSNG